MTIRRLCARYPNQSLCICICDIRKEPDPTSRDPSRNCQRSRSLSGLLPVALFFFFRIAVRSVRSVMAASTSMAVTRSAGLGLWSSSAVCRCSRPSPSASAVGGSQKRRSFATQAPRPRIQDGATAPAVAGGPSRPRARSPEVRPVQQLAMRPVRLGPTEHHRERARAVLTTLFCLCTAATPQLPLVRCTGRYQPVFGPGCLERGLGVRDQKSLLSSRPATEDSGRRQAAILTCSADVLSRAL